MKIDLTLDEVRMAMRLWLDDTCGDNFKIESVSVNNTGITMKLSIEVKKNED